MNKDKSDIAKELLRIVKEKPYIFKGLYLDIDYYEIAKDYPQFFILRDYAIFSKIQLKEFWEYEISVQLVLSNKLSLSDIYLYGLESFETKYGIKHPRFNATDFNLSENDMNKLSFTLGRFSNYYYEADPYQDYPDLYNSDEAFLLFTRMLNLNENKFFINTDNVELRKIKNYSDEYIITNILLKSKNRKMKTALLQHAFNTFPIEEVSNITISELIQIVEKNKGYFRYNKENTEVSLNNFLDEPKASLKKVRIKYNEITNNNYYKNSGITALTIDSIGFPLKEAKGYLQLRDYLFITATENASEFIKNIFDFSRIEDDSSLINNLLSVYFQDEEIENSLIKETIEMLKEQIQYSYYPMEFERAEEFADYLKIELAPIFNFEEFTGNLFYKTIKRKIEKFTKTLKEVKKGNKKNSEKIEL